MSHDVKKILIVDDDPICLKIMKTLLVKNYAFDIETFDAPDKVLTHLYDMEFEEQPKWYDLIFMDVRLPVLKGDTLIKIIKETESKLISKPIVAITGFLDEEVTRQLKKVGITDIIEKPITLEKLAMVIEKYLNVLPPVGKTRAI
jgi:FixJ family two-component response regulator